MIGMDRGSAKRLAISGAAKAVRTQTAKPRSRPADQAAS
jgi:hypothetical protein